MTDKRQNELTTATELDATDTVLGFRTSDEEDVQVPLSVLDTRFAANPAALAANVAFSTTFQGLDTDLTAIAGAGNSDVLVLTDAVFDEYKESDLSITSITADEHRARLDDLESRATSGGADQQVIAAAAGENLIDLALGTNIHVVSTAGAWTAVFQNVPSGGVVVNLSINVTTDGHEPTFQNVKWYVTGPGGAPGAEPVTADWDTNETNVIRLTKLPLVDKWIAEWIFNDPTPDPDPTVILPTLTASYSTSNTRTSPVTLASATLPAGEVAVFFGPSGNTDIESFRIFCNHTGALPAVGAEGDSYVRTTSASPYDLIGVSGANALMWDTNVDPTGNNRIDYSSNGSTTITVQAKMIDGQTVEATFTFNTDNNPVGSAATDTHTSSVLSPGTTSTTVTVPDGVDRAVLVVATYASSPYSGSTMIMDGLTLNGVAMTELVAGTRDTTLSTGLGTFVAWLPEASLTTGALTLAPVYASAPNAASAVGYDVWVFTNVATPALGAIFDFDNVGEGLSATPSPSIAAVPASSYLMTVGAEGYPYATDLTVDIGTMTTPVVRSTSNKLKTRSATLADSGVSATETANWTCRGRAIGVLVYLSYTASPGGEEVTPITPGTPVISSTVAADNQLTVTWGAAANAVSYELRHGATNPPATSPIVGVTSPRVITGLAASVVRYVQVRAKSSTGHYSAWSTVSSGTPTGTGTGGGGGSEKFIVSDNAFDCAYSQGNGPMRFSDLWIPTTTVRKNPATTDTALSNMMINAEFDGAINNYVNRSGGNDTAFIDAMGPRLIWTMKASVAGKNANKGTATEIATGLLDMAKAGSKGTIHKNLMWAKIGSDLNTQYRGFNKWEICYFSIAHETTGPWTLGYMGVVPSIRNHPLLLAATRTQYGDDMYDAIQLAAATGECSAVHRLYVEHGMETLWDINPNIIIGMTPADGASSTPEDLVPNALGDTWVYDAFPRESLGFKPDFICSTIYARGDNNMVYDGSGSQDDRTNWSRPDGFLEHTVEYITRYGCAGGLLESGAAYALPGTVPGSSGNNSQSDEAAVAFMQLLHEDTLPTIYANNLLFVNWWTVLNWSPYANPGTSCSFHPLEGMYGAWPDGTAPTSTAKPTWSTQDGTRYVKTMNYLRSKF